MKYREIFITRSGTDNPESAFMYDNEAKRLVEAFNKLNVSPSYTKVVFEATLLDDSGNEQLKTYINLSRVDNIMVSMSVKGVN